MLEIDCLWSDAWKYRDFALNNYRGATETISKYLVMIDNDNKFTSGLWLAIKLADTKQAARQTKLPLFAVLGFLSLVLESLFIYDRPRV